ncbi:MAG: Crp/Fnr family transcriptional regulator [Candidatus Koribacter versatilis]|uniref:Crp/Fnr family transcriptional regulator n=1 Tax=Candidatus Korobacter versatilis TaxID=658062 RepID=A0A932EQR0_9BACT|nr:Crp/Fnr family transcriptional regulator [Candidatus Koribacter versatilis]
MAKANGKHNGKHNGDNLLLGRVTAESYARLAPNLSEVALEHGDVLYRADDAQEWIYFPAKGTLISLLAVTEEGETVEVAITGREGMLGIAGVLGAGRSNHDSMVQNGGNAWRARAEHVRAAMEEDAEFRGLILRYVHVIFLHAAQTALCNRLHSVEERLARWMLSTQDRVEAPEFYMTHELLAKMLGARRASVSLTAAVLQKAGMLRYRRGHMIIMDRKALEGTACACYGEMRAEMQKFYDKR